MNNPNYRVPIWIWLAQGFSLFSETSVDENLADIILISASTLYLSVVEIFFKVVHICIHVLIFVVTTAVVV